MRRLQSTMWAATLVAIAVGGWLASARAQQSMTFRPLPAESVARLEDQATVRAGNGAVDIHATGKNGKRALDLHIDSTGVRMNIPTTGGGHEEPEPPAPPAPPESPGAHETTGDIVRFGSDIDVPAGQVVEGDVVSVGGSVRVEGEVKGSVTSIGGDVSLNAGARVDGDVVCLSGTLRQEPGSSVGGQRVTAPRVPGSHLWLPMLSVVGTGVRVVTHLVMMALLLLVSFVVVKLAPGRTQGALDTIRDEGGASFLVGLAIWGLLIPSLVVLVLVVAILCITIIGIPLALAVLLGYALFLTVALIWGAVVGYAVLGEQLHLRFRGGKADLVAAAFWGVIALCGLRIVADFLHVVPVFGFFGGLIKVISIVASWVLATLGAGALVRAEYRRRTVQNWWMRSRTRRSGGASAAGGPVEDDFPPPPVAPPPAAGPSSPEPPAPPAPEPPSPVV